MHDFFDGLSQDHPRSGGKDFFDFVIRIYHSGSPPLVRERPDQLS